MTVKKHIRNQMSQQSCLKTGLDFYLLLSLLKAELTANRQSPCNTRFTFMLQHLLSVVCLCVFNSDVIKELLEPASHQPHVLKMGGGKKRLELEDNQCSLFTYFLVKPV